MAQDKDDKEKKEIIVKAPSKPVISPEKKAEKAIEKSLEEERFRTLLTSKKFGSYFAATTLLAGTILLGLFVYVLFTGQIEWISLSSEAGLFSLALWFFAGIVTLISGLLLLGND